MKSKEIFFPKGTADSLLNLFFKSYSIYENESNKLIAVNDETKIWCFLEERKKVKKILRNLYYQETLSTVSDYTINTVYETISSFETNDKIVTIDLLYNTKKFLIYNIKGSKKYVRVSAGNVKICEKSKSKYLFKEYDNKSVFIPQKSIKYNYFSAVSKLFPNTDRSQRILLSVYLVSLFIKNISHPIFVISGEYGAGKSTTLRMMSKIIEPTCENISTLPSKVDDVAVIINSGYYACFDNISNISREVADLLCIAATGGIYQKRALYTDSSVSSLDVKRPIALNGINLEIEYNDMIDRCIILNFKRISEKSRKSEEELWKEFYSCLPKLQFSIFSIIARAMEKVEDVKITSPSRLVDFTKWGYAIAEAISEGMGDEFLRELKINSKRSERVAIESNPFLLALEDFMARNDYWSGSATELLKNLKEKYYSTNATNILPNSFPKSANVLSRRLNSLQTSLKSIGLQVEITKSAQRTITIKKTDTEVM